MSKMKWRIASTIILVALFAGVLHIVDLRGQAQAQNGIQQQAQELAQIDQATAAWEKTHPNGTGAVPVFVPCGPDGGVKPDGILHVKYPGFDHTSYFCVNDHTDVLDNKTGTWSHF